MSACKDFYEIYEPLAAISSELSLISILLLSGDISDMHIPVHVAGDILEGIADHVQRLEEDLRGMEEAYEKKQRTETIDKAEIRSIKPAN